MAATLQRILVLKADRMYAELLSAETRAMFPTATVDYACELQAVPDLLCAGAIDLLITGLGLRDGDMLDFLYIAMRERRNIGRVLIATGRRDQQILQGLENLPLDGAFDSARGDLSEFRGALRAVASGSAYWSPTLQPARNVRQAPHTDVRLTPVEKLVLAVIGDGCDDRHAAQLLGVQASAIHSTRRQLHRKLGVQHKGELVRVAVQRGFIRFSEDAVVRPGYAMLLAGCGVRQRHARGDEVSRMVSIMTKAEEGQLAQSRASLSHGDPAFDRGAARGLESADAPPQTELPHDHHHRQHPGRDGLDSTAL